MSNEVLTRLVWGAVLAELRKLRGLSQKDAAARAGLTQGTLSRWERGEVYPPAQLFLAVVESLGVSLAEFDGLVKRSEAGAKDLIANARLRCLDGVPESAYVPISAAAAAVEVGRWNADRAPGAADTGKPGR